MRVRSSRGGERGASVPQPGTFVRGAEGAKGLPCFPSLPCLPGVETGRRGSFDFCPLPEKDLFPDGTGLTAALGLSPLRPRGRQLSGQGRPQVWGSPGCWDRGVSAEPRQNFPSGATM